jgi:hypothetical protein
MPASKNSIRLRAELTFGEPGSLWTVISMPYCTEPGLDKWIAGKIKKHGRPRRAYVEAYHLLHITTINYGGRRRG